MAEGLPVRQQRLADRGQLVGGSRPFTGRTAGVRLLIGLGSRHSDSSKVRRNGSARLDGVERGCRHGEKVVDVVGLRGRSEEHTSELQSLMRISYAVFCLQKKIPSDRVS